MKNQCVNYQDLEFATSLELAEQRKSALTSKLNRIWNTITKLLTTLNEPKVHFKESKSGSTYWEINDPSSGRRVFFDTEIEVREWLDRRYYE